MNSSTEILSTDLDVSMTSSPDHHFLPRGMVTASSPLTVASRRRPIAQEDSICMDKDRQRLKPTGIGAKQTWAEPRQGWSPEQCPGG
jgi:hypothetical protein